MQINKEIRTAEERDETVLHFLKYHQDLLNEYFQLES